MKNFYDIEELADYMYETVEEDIPVSAIVNKDLAVEIMQEFLDHDNIELTGSEYNSANIDVYEYDREYSVGLCYNGKNKPYSLAVLPIYNYDAKKYLSTDGIALFHEDVNSKALVDMQENKDFPIIGHDWFAIGEIDDSCDDGGDNGAESAAQNDVTASSDYTGIKYFVNGKQTTKEEYDKKSADFEKRFQRVLLSYCDFVTEMDKWRRLLNW